MRSFAIIIALLGLAALAVHAAPAHKGGHHLHRFRAQHKHKAREPEAEPDVLDAPDFTEEQSEVLPDYVISKETIAQFEHSSVGSFWKKFLSDKHIKRALRSFAAIVDRCNKNKDGDKASAIARIKTCKKYDDLEHSNESAEDLLHSIRQAIADAPFVINFNPQPSWFLASDHQKTIYEVNELLPEGQKRAKIYVDGRDKAEKWLFGYNDNPTSKMYGASAVNGKKRPLSVGINFLNRVLGVATEYGNSTVVLKDDVKLRCSVCGMDTYGLCTEKEPMAFHPTTPTDVVVGAGMQYLGIVSLPDASVQTMHCDTIHIFDKINNGVELGTEDIAKYKKEYLEANAFGGIVWAEHLVSLNLFQGAFCATPDKWKEVATKYTGKFELKVCATKTDQEAQVCTTPDMFQC